MDRRDFLKKAGMSAAIMGFTACTSKGVGTSEDNSTPDTEGLKGKMAENYPGIGILGYGCMRWPETADKDGNTHIDQEEVNRLVDFALEHGVNYYDTSPVYLQGDSERATSIALNRHPRDKWILATKLSNFSDSSYDNSVRMYRRSLEIFNTDYIDFYLLHSISGGDNFEKRFGSTGIMDFLLKEREAGHIRKLGFSFHGHREGFDELVALHDKYHWDFVQIQMNYVDWNNASGRNTNASYMYEVLDKLEIPIIVMEPLLGGRLANIPASIAAELKSREPGKSTASWAFRFCASHPRVMCILSGMTYMEHLQDNLENLLDFKPLTENEMEFLDMLGKKINDFPLVKCTGCQYCMPCPYGIDIPGIFRFYNDQINADSYVSSKEQRNYARTRRRYLLEYNKAIPSVRQADHCINCGKCVSHCPQKIKIPAELRRIDEYVESLKQETIR